MPLPDLFSFLSGGDRLVEKIAQEVADRCRPDVLRRVYRATGAMSLPQIRGYVRAYAASTIHAETTAAMNWYGLGPERFAEVVAQAMALVIAMVACDLVNLAAEPRRSRAAA